jgi:hypothetical protein
MIFSECGTLLCSGAGVIILFQNQDINLLKLTEFLISHVSIEEVLKPRQSFHVKDFLTAIRIIGKGKTSGSVVCYTMSFLFTSITIYVIWQQMQPIHK